MERLFGRFSVPQYLYHSWSEKIQKQTKKHITFVHHQTSSGNNMHTHSQKEEGKMPGLCLTPGKNIAWSCPKDRTNYTYDGRWSCCKHDCIAPSQLATVHQVNVGEKTRELITENPCSWLTWQYCMWWHGHIGRRKEADRFHDRMQFLGQTSVQQTLMSASKQLIKKKANNQRMLCIWVWKEEEEEPSSTHPKHFS